MRGPGRQSSSHAAAEVIGSLSAVAGITDFDHEGMDRGAAAMKRTARTTSISMTVTTTFQYRYRVQTAKTKPSTALKWSVRKKIRQEALDAQGSFRNAQMNKLYRERP